MEGFQLWLNLPARDKLCQPWYRDFGAGELPHAAAPGGVDVTVIAGASHGVRGAVTRDATDVLYLDVHIPKEGGVFEQAVPPGNNAFVYVYRGAMIIEGQEVAAGRMALLRTEPGCDGLRLQAREAARALVIAGRPLGEPIAQYGPFVMNTQQEIYQAVADYRDGRMG